MRFYRISHILRIHLLLIVVGLMCTSAVVAANSGKILVITSYNPDTQKMYTTLSDFTSALNKEGGEHIDVAIESMNCKNLSEAYDWKERMENILNDYRKNPPALIILLGQEAWTSYLSQNTEIARRTPCMACLVSTNTVLLPNDTVNLRNWKPKSIEYTDIKKFNIVGGIFYKYDIENSLKLTHRFYPGAKSIALITDFTFGGLAMQSHVVECLKRHKDIKLTLLDGRHNTLFEMCNNLQKLNSNTVLWIGTWRIDSSENYVLANTTDVLHAANTKIPTFSLSSVGLGNWAIGGYVPEYSLQGEKLAKIACRFIRNGKKDNGMFITLPCKYSIDEKQLEAFNLKGISLPPNAVLINTHTDFFTQHKNLVIWTIAVLLFLTLCLLYAIYDIVRIRRYKDSLEQKSRELKAAKEVAEEANSIKTSFIANMSHEIRTPLNAIVGFTDLIVQDDYDKEDKAQFSAIIKENSNMLLNLINEILDISRIESGHISISNEECEVISLCHSTLASVRQASHLKNVEFREELPAGKITILTDQTRLRQVITNLLTNASKFTKEGSITLSLKIDEKAKVMTFAVTDTGIGIPKDKAEYIFERFAKLNQYVQGTGLGLALCRIIVGCLGGKIWVDKEHTGGACFKFTHPLSKPKEDEETETVEAKKQ